MKSTINDLDRKGDKVMLSIKYLIFKERLMRKLVDQYVSLYIIEEMVFSNVVKLRLLTLIRIYPVVNVSQEIKYREPVEGQKVKEVKLIEVKEIKE